MKIIRTGIILAGIFCFFAGNSIAEKKYPTVTDRELMELIKKLDITPKQSVLFIENYSGNSENLDIEIYKKAKKHILRQIKLSSAPKLFFRKALVEEMLDNRKQAIKDISKAIKFAPNEAKYYYTRGRFYKDIGEYDKAFSDFNKAIELNPKIAFPYHSRSLLYKTQPNYKMAARDFEKFLKICPNSKFKRIVKEKDCRDLVLIHKAKIQGCPTVEDYKRIGVFDRVIIGKEKKRNARDLISKECCESECWEYQTKCCIDEECTDYDPYTGECINWKCNKWVDCKKEKCKCVKLCE